MHARLYCHRQCWRSFVAPQPACCSAYCAVWSVDVALALCTGEHLQRVPGDVTSSFASALSRRPHRSRILQEAFPIQSQIDLETLRDAKQQLYDPRRTVAPCAGQTRTSKRSTSACIAWATTRAASRTCAPRARSRHASAGAYFSGAPLPRHASVHFGTALLRTLGTLVVLLSISSACDRAAPLKRQPLFMQLATITGDARRHSRSA